MDDLKDLIGRTGLKVTPQRMWVMQALLEMHHPTAEQVMAYLKEKYSGISTGTVYSTLESFVQKGLINRVKTDRGGMRYDSVTKDHHHLYCEESDTVKDYYDDELNHMLKEYFDRKKIPGFSVHDIRLQISGKFGPEQDDN